MHATRAAVSSSALLALSIVVLLLPPSSRPFFPSRTPPLLIDGDKAHAGGGACDYSDGAWVKTDADAPATVIYYGEDCPFLDPGFQCARNGRSNSSFRHWRWQPRGCDLPKFNAREMLERSRNRRIVFAGDSIGRNQWESMVCMLASAATGGGSSKIYEQSGKPIGRHRGYLAMVFADYNLSVEYYRAPMLVMVDRFPPGASGGGGIRGAVRLDALPRHAGRWAGADVLVLNTGHWWNLHKTIKAGNYFMVGKRLNVTTDIREAFRLSLRTVRRWELSRARLSRKSYLFFRSFSPSHYSNGTWDTGGSCAAQQEPLAATAGGGGEEEYSWMNAAIASAVRALRSQGRNARFLNITHMTELRRDGHPARHREPGTPPDALEDCSHWCLPGVPDAWNQVLYAHLLSMGYATTTKHS